MIYDITLDDNVIHSTEIKDLKIFDPKVTIEQNKIGNFQFTIHKNNPYYSKIEKMKSKVHVKQNGVWLFDGRVIETTENTNKSINVYCESIEAYLCDTIHDPFEFNGSITNLLTEFIDNHNSQVSEEKQFKIGKISVTDPNDYIVRSSENYDTTWNRINDKLIKLLGGYIVIRHEDDGNYIDYLADFDEVNSQHVTLGKNLISVKIDEDFSNVATVLIPLGAKDEETDKRLTIESVNKGIPYIENDEMVAKYGRIVTYHEWDDVTIASNLLTKGKAYLKDLAISSKVIEVSAIDMGNANSNIANFKMYQKIKVVSKLHNIDEYFTPTKMTIDLFKPSNNKITLSGEQAVISDVKSIIQTEVDKSYGDNLSVYEEKLYKTTQDITLLVSNTKNDLEKEIKKNAEDITLLVSNTKNDLEKEIKKNAEDITLLVPKASVISNINNSEETELIDPSKVDLKDIVTKEDLSEEGKSEINGANIIGDITLDVLNGGTLNNPVVEGGNFSLPAIINNIGSGNAVNSVDFDASFSIIDGDLYLNILKDDKTYSVLLKSDVLKVEDN